MLYEVITQTEDKMVKLTGGYFLKKGNDQKAASQYDAAMVSLNRAIEIEAENVTAYYLLTSIYNSQNNWDQAIEMAQKGLSFETEANKARFYFELGIV